MELRTSMTSLPNSPPRGYSHYLKQLTALEQDGVALSMWEQAFLAGLRARFQKGWVSLTDTQAEILADLYEQKTGKDAAP